MLLLAGRVRPFSGGENYEEGVQWRRPPSAHMGDDKHR